MSIQKKISYLKKSIAVLSICTLNCAHASWLGDTWNDGVNEIKTVYTTGNDQLWVSGLAHHGRNTYSAEKLATLNERAWGLGWGKTLRKDGVHRGVFGLAILDSHKEMQYQLGYTYEKAHYFNKDWYIAGGVAPVIIRREDMFNKLPFPAIFPLVSFGNQAAEIRMLYIPRLSKNLGNGDVLYVFATVKF
jgi:palmitoyl transferase